MHNTKYIFVTGGVVSSLGKGITASSLGRILKNRGLKVSMQKFDPYINVDPGTMSPYQHGEVFVTQDGAETDLDIGHYERFIDEELNRYTNITTGKIYQEVINKERRGDYLGATIQVIPHVTDAIQDKLREAAKTTNADVIITEIGGTVGDIESLPFLDAIRQWRNEIGEENTFYLHTTLVPYLEGAKELKTKPTQHSVKELKSLGIDPDAIVLRSSHPITDEMKEKIALFCDVKKTSVIEALNETIIYEAANNLKRQGLDGIICEHFNFPEKEADMREWNAMIDTIRNLDTHVTIGIIGKYTALKDAYLSVSEALVHGGYPLGVDVRIKWIDAEHLEKHDVKDTLADIDGLLVPGGFGSRGTEGKMNAIRHARKEGLPFLGICFGMHLATIEFARSILGMDDASSTEINPATSHPIIDLLPDQTTETYKGATMRLGNYPCALEEGSLAHRLYRSPFIVERHRHRYEFNNAYKQAMENAGMRFSGVFEDKGLVEIIELDDHPYFIAVQFHPEFKSRPTRAHPLFQGLVEAAKKRSSLL